MILRYRLFKGKHPDKLTRVVVNVFDTNISEGIYDVVRVFNLDNYFENEFEVDKMKENLKRTLKEGGLLVYGSEEGGELFYWAFQKREGELVQIPTKELGRVNRDISFDEKSNDDDYAMNTEVNMLNRKAQLEKLSEVLSQEKYANKPDIVEHVVEILERYSEEGKKIVIELGAGATGVALALAENNPKVGVIASDIYDNNIFGGYRPIVAGYEDNDLVGLKANLDNLEVVKIDWIDMLKALPNGIADVVLIANPHYPNQFMKQLTSEVGRVLNASGGRFIIKPNFEDADKQYREYNAENPSDEWGRDVPALVFDGVSFSNMRTQLLFDVNIDKTTSFSKGDYLFEWSSDDAMAEQQNQEPRTEEQGKDMVGALRSKEQEAGLSLPSKEDLFRIAKAEKTAVLMTSSLENKILRFLRKSHPESYTADILSAGFVLVRQDLEKMAQAMELSFDGLHKELDLLPGVEKVIVINQLPRRHGGQHDFYATILEEVFHVLEGDVRSDKNWNTSNHRGAAEAVNSFLQILFIPNNKLGKFLEVNKGSMYWSEAETKALMRRYRERSPFNPNMHIREILQQLKEDVENKKRIMIEGKRPLISDVVLKRIGSSEGWLLEYLEILLKYERLVVISHCLRIGLEQKRVFLRIALWQLMLEVLT